MLEKSMWQGTAGSLLRGFNQSAAKNQGPHSYTLKEMSSASNLSDLEVNFFPN